ncbi:MAG: Wadjet anti-phage system protein JetD domain-containing protein, partial [Clostridiaceae bacterium]
TLNIYRTPEPFVYFSSNKSINQVVLIIENKDTWYTLRKLMLEGKNTFLGEKIDTIIYGAGKNIEKSLEEYEYTVEKYLLNPAKVYYFGDLDYEGISIYERVNKRYKNKLNIQLYKAGYQAMILLSRKMQLSKCSERQNKNIGEVFLSDMKCYENEILSILKGGCYIPQEIVNYMVLKEDNLYV